MELLKGVLRPKMLSLLILASLQQYAAASEPLLHHSQVFLNSVYLNSRIQAPRIGLSAMHTFLAHPSFLQRWGILSADAAASYNSITNTLVLQPAMTIYDSAFGSERLASLQEIRNVTGTPARVAAGIIFHEMSHAEFDLYVEEGAEDYDRALMNVLRAEAPALIATNGISAIKAFALTSEIFAYYREELFSMILNDTAEIKLANGLDPDINVCTPIRQIPNNARNFSPTSVPYSKRVDLRQVWVAGTFVNLALDPVAHQRLNDALFAHASATMTFPESRAELLKVLRTDSSVRAAMDTCRSLKPQP